MPGQRIQWVYKELWKMQTPAWQLFTNVLKRPPFSLILVGVPSKEALIEPSSQSSNSTQIAEGLYYA